LAQSLRRHSTKSQQTSQVNSLILGSGWSLCTRPPDARMTRLMAENTLVSYRTALDAPLHRNLSEITIRRHYDVVDSLEAIAPREVTPLNPADAPRQAMHLEQTHERLSATIQSEQNLCYKDRIRLVRRSAHDPFPTE